MARTRRFHCLGPSSIPGQGTKIPATRVAQPKEKKKTVSNSILKYLSTAINMDLYRALSVRMFIVAFVYNAKLEAMQIP